MKILCTNAQDALAIDEAQVKRLVQVFLSWKRVECQEVNIHIVEKQEITHLHKLHFNDATPTDCISFPIDTVEDEKSGYKILGEVFVCPQVALEYAQKHRISPHREVSLYIIHGLLHLLGFDDQDQTSEPIMRKEEKSALHYLEQNEALLYG